MAVAGRSVIGPRAMVASGGQNAKAVSLVVGIVKRQFRISQFLGFYSF